MNKTDIANIKRAISSITEITIVYVDLMKNLVENETGSDQAMMLQGGLLALNHAAGAMERLCRILEKYESGNIPD